MVPEQNAASRVHQSQRAAGLSLRPTVGNRPPATGLRLTGVEKCQAAKQHLSLNGPQAEMTATSPHSHGEEECPLLLLGKVAAQRDTVIQKLVGQAQGSRQKQHGARAK